MEKEEEKAPRQFSATSGTLPKLKTAPTRLALLSTLHVSGPPTIRKILAVLRAFQTAFHDLKSILATAQWTCKDGRILVQIYWPGWWLDIDSEGYIVAGEVDK